MKEGFIISASWKFLTRSMLATLPTLGMDEPRAFYKKARAIYRREMCKLTEYGEGDVLKLNLAQAVMLGAVYDCHYVRKSAVTEAEREKSQSDKRAEALRGGRTVV